MIVHVDSLRKLITYDPSIGPSCLKWLVNRRPRGKANCMAGTKRKDGYWMVSFEGKQIGAHRIIWALHSGHWAKDFIDHIDGNQSNNAIENLRQCSHPENHQNLKLKKSNSTGYPGVSFESKTGKYQAHIMTNGKSIRLGRFDSAEEASQSYIQAKEKHHQFNPRVRA